MRQGDSGATEVAGQRAVPSPKRANPPAQFRTSCCDQARRNRGFHVQGSAKVRSRGFSQSVSELNGHRPGVAASGLDSGARQEFVLSPEQPVEGAEGPGVMTSDLV